MSKIEQIITEATGSPFESTSSSSLSGGCINEASRIIGVDGRDFFIKKNQLSFLPFFEAEANALSEIRNTRTIPAPEAIGYGVENKEAFLVMEFIGEGSSSSRGQAELGKLLARMHRIEQPYFGWSMDNCIGATPQPNPKSENWIHFYRDHRLAHQFSLAAQKGRYFDGAEELLSRIEFFSQPTTLIPPCFMEISGEGTPAMTRMENHSFLIRQLITGTGKRILPSPTCLEDSVPPFTMHMIGNILSTKVLPAANRCTTFITN